MNIFAQDLVGRNTADPASAPGSSTDYIGRKEPLEPEDDEDLEALIDAEGEEASLTQMLSKSIEEQMSKQACRQGGRDAGRQA